MILFVVKADDGNANSCGIFPTRKEAVKAAQVGLGETECTHTVYRSKLVSDSKSAICHFVNSHTSAKGLVQSSDFSYVKIGEYSEREWHWEKGHE